MPVSYGDVVMLKGEAYTGKVSSQSHSPSLNRALILSQSATLSRTLILPEDEGWECTVVEDKGHQVALKCTSPHDALAPVPLLMVTALPLSLRQLCLCPKHELTRCCSSANRTGSGTPSLRASSTLI